MITVASEFDLARSRVVNIYMYMYSLYICYNRFSMLSVSSKAKSGQALDLDLPVHVPVPVVQSVPENKDTCI